VNAKNPYEEEKKFIKTIDELCQKIWEIGIEDKYPDCYDYDLLKLKEIKDKLTTRKEVKEDVEEQTEGKYELKKLWRKVFSNYVFKQPVYADFFFHCVMGGLFFHDFKIVRNGIVDEDIRVHPVIIGPTGIGKSEANDFIMKIVNKIPKRLYIDAEGNRIMEHFVSEPLGKATDAGMIGTVETELDIMQKQRKIFPTKKTKDGKIEPNPLYTDPVVAGVLKKSDFVVVDEAESIFKTGKDNIGIQRILRTAMNRYGSKQNILANDSAKCKGRVKFNCSASVVMTSFMVKEFDETYHKGGLLQRVLLFIDFEDTEKRKGIANKVAASYSTEVNFEVQKKREEARRDYEKLVNKLIKIKKKEMIWTSEQWDPKKRKEMKISNDTCALIYKYAIQLIDIPLTVSQQEIYHSTLVRTINSMFRLSVHNAISEERKTIIKSDVDLVFEEIMVKQADSISDYLRKSMGNTEEDKLFDKNKQILVRTLKQFPKGMQKSELNEIMMKKWNVGRNRTISNLKRMEERKVYETLKGDKAEKICKLIGGINPSWLEE